MKNKKIALVTGANKGIGLEICRQLAHEGVQVVLTSRDEARGIEAQRLLARHGAGVDYRRVDVTEPASMESAFTYVSEKYGKLDILVNNAGILPDQNARGVSVSAKTVREVFETNTLGAFQVSQRFLPLLRKSESGRIINLSSGLGSLSDMGGGYPAYRISKAALNAVTLILADELRELGISVNAVCPGWVKTDMGGKNAERPVEKGASGIVKLALLEKEVPTGKFLRDGREIPW
jgi:NAD(P)-dependent dehydrogenase (short-subunit alcohol dehydrogenase family)